MGKFVYDIVGNPKVFEENRLPAHSDHIVYKSASELMAGKTSLRLPLDGVWEFHYSKNIKDAPLDFFEDSYDTSSWDRIHVPAHIQMEGYDKPQYVNVQYPWDGRECLTPPEIPQMFNPVGDYVKHLHFLRALAETKSTFLSRALRAALHSGSMENM